MNKMIVALLAGALALPTATLAQNSDSNSAKEYAPGQQPGAAKKSAPGQVKEPGESAKEYAPGQKAKEDAANAGKKSGQGTNTGGSTGSSSGSAGSTSGSAGSQ